MDERAKVEQARHGESLEQVGKRFERWRDARVRGEHIPTLLWAAAVAMAKQHGLHRVRCRTGERARREDAGGTQR
jgi:hypothetical protein